MDENEITKYIDDKLQCVISDFEYYYLNRYKMATRNRYMVKVTNKVPLLINRIINLKKSIEYLESELKELRKSSKWWEKMTKEPIEESIEFQMRKEFVEEAEEAIRKIRGNEVNNEKS